MVKNLKSNKKSEVSLCPLRCNQFI